MLCWKLTCLFDASFSVHIILMFWFRNFDGISTYVLVIVLHGLFDFLFNSIYLQYLTWSPFIDVDVWLQFASKRLLLTYVSLKVQCLLRLYDHDFWFCCTILVLPSLIEKQKWLCGRYGDCARRCYVLWSHRTYFVTHL